MFAKGQKRQGNRERFDESTITIRIPDGNFSEIRFLRNAHCLLIVALVNGIKFVCNLASKVTLCGSSRVGFENEKRMLVAQVCHPPTDVFRGVKERNVRGSSCVESSHKYAQPSGLCPFRILFALRIYSQLCNLFQSSLQILSV